MSSPSQNGGNRPAAKAEDRRVHERLTVSPRLYVILDGAASDGILNDVSEGGVALDMMGAQPENDTVELRFEMAEIGRHFEAKGRVAWRDEAGRRVGVGFVDLPEVSRGHIKEWLAAKGAAAEPLVAAAVQAVIPEVVRDGASQLPAANGSTVTAQPGASETSSGTGTWHSAGEPYEGDRLLQSLLNSFSKPQTATPPREPGIRGFAADAVSRARIFFSAWETRRWIFVLVAIVVVVLVLLGLSALRSPAKNASAAFSLSKVGHRMDAGGSAGEADSKGGKGNGEAAGGGSNGNGPPLSQIPTAALVASLSKASATPGHLPCVNLGPRSDKIRVYLWSEKGTPESILQSYSRYLTAVSDIRVADKAPYDLVLYINGANVDAKSSEAGFIWTSRVFRPWFCGQGLGLLEQTEVNESLHYTRGEDLDQRVQAEVAYLILHSLETIRNEQPKQ